MVPEITRSLLTYAAMRAVVQRVSEAAVSVDGREVSRIGPGLLVLLGVAQGDGEADLLYLADKVVNLRVFADEAGHMNRSLLEAGGALLVVSQFTLLGDARKGRRPGFTDAAPPEQANALYRQFVERTRQSGVRVEEGVFRAMMDVSLVNQGPVTLLLDSRKLF
jgi:D-aminoacyl-tRNA deacylase